MNENKKSVLAAIAENPVLVLFLGACPAMAQSTNVLTALGMGIAVLLVLLLTAVTMSALKKLIPEGSKLAASILVAAGFTALVQILMSAFVPGIYQKLGVYLAVVAVDLLVFSGAEKAAGRTAGECAADALVTGLGFTAILVVMAIVREFFGSGSFAGIKVPFMANFTIPALTKAPGGFIVLAIAAAVVNTIRSGKLAADGKTGAAAGICPENNAQGE